MSINQINSNEALMVYLINRIGKLYPDHAILKGGMVLRLLNCPRYTNDIDYVFIPFKSKKDILPLMEKLIKELESAEYTYAMHSTALRIQIKYRGFQTQIEANVEKECKSEPLSTNSLAIPNNQEPQIIRVMGFDWMLANKLAAWLERRLVRDLYDAYFMSVYLNITPNLEVLKKRLNKIKYMGRKIKNEPTKMSLETFLGKLETATKTLSENDIDSELRDSLSPTERAGLNHKMKIGILSMIEKIK